MARLLFSNNASALLATSIGPSDTAIHVDAGYGALFPLPGANEYFKVTLENADGDIEICHCTARTTDVLTVERAQEGTAATSWTSGQTRVECRLTQETMEEFIQRSGDTMTGDLGMGGNNITAPRLTGSPVMVGGQTVGTAIRGTEDDASNELVVPSDGSRATVGGAAIATIAEFNTLLPIGAVIMWYGSLMAIPAGWALCDGSNGTPDLRDRFPIGAGGSFAPGAAAGSLVSGANGAHTHSGATGSTALTISQIPAHNHLDGAAIRADGFGPASPNGRVIVNPEYTWEHHQRRTNNTVARNYSDNTGGGAGHTHTISSDGAHTHTIDRPPYRAIYFIMKVADFTP